MLSLSTEFERALGLKLELKYAPVIHSNLEPLRDGAPLRPHTSQAFRVVTLNGTAATIPLAVGAQRRCSPQPHRTAGPLGIAIGITIDLEYPSTWSSLPLELAMGWGGAGWVGWGGRGGVGLGVGYLGRGWGFPGAGVLGLGSHPGWYRDKVLAMHGASIRKSLYILSVSGSAGKRRA